MIPDKRKLKHLPISSKVPNLSEIDSNVKRLSRFKTQVIDIGQTINEESEIIDPIIFDEFIQYLTIAKFKEFAENCKEREMENTKHDMHLKKNQFIQIMKNSFLPDDKFTKLYEKIFNKSYFF